jgi:hypothetical protein
MLTIYVGRNLNAILLSIQFVNKLIYAREGAKDMMDRSCSDLPWHVRLLALKLMGRTLKFGAALFNALIC